MKITITGGSGVLGQNLIPTLLASGHKVKSLDLTPAKDNLDYEQIIGDIRDSLSCK